MSNNEVKNIAIIGLGGQGVITLTKLLANTYLTQGRDVCYNEMHGLSQRGGSVQSFMRVNEPANPVFLSQDTHTIIGLEKLETLRYLYTAKEAKPVVIVTNKYEIRSTADLGLEKFPDSAKIDEEIAKHSSALYIFDAIQFEKSFKGLFKPLNVALFSALTSISDFDLSEEVAKEIVTKLLGKNIVLKRTNMKAFRDGSKWLKKVN
ncbi:MAG: 2-oxoacid:acceptor oxidoreductase family protein [Candidatus Heimdallarchaeaceae archaeon]